MRLHDFYIVLILAGLAGIAAAAPADRGSFALQTSIWKPSTLDDEPSKPFKPVEGTDLSWGAGVCSPDVSGFALRLSLWQWQQRGVVTTVPLDKVQLRHLAVDLKYNLLGATSIRPYVVYGGSALYGREVAAASFSTARDHFSFLGMAFTIGAGIDFLPFRHWGLSAEYQYLYVDLDEELGLTSRYSGPKVTCKLLYLF
jgi:opacity protein-like surface antigen